MNAGPVVERACRRVTPVARKSGTDGGVLPPDLARKAGVGDLLAEDGVGLAEGLEAVAGDGAEAVGPAQAGAGEGLALDHVLEEGRARGRRRGPRP